MQESGPIVERMVAGSLVANNATTLRRMALAGAGLARIADYQLREDPEAGWLIEVLKDSVLEESDEIHADFRGSAHMPARMRAFLDHFVPPLQKFLSG
ncbi:LysR substrate-binding domain-containing protein [Paracoccus litorisediminis]|jgi:DNA-binding transcriptional LysR family regulator|uniref:LysR substrate-binding domain-containing protein n=1 Tax=Paracoccus litorisediminis TaxID=2006130 RepID=UPI001B8D0BEB